MGTKTNPGEYDAYAAAGPDEPIFVLRAHDPLAPEVVKAWASMARDSKIVPTWKSSAADRVANDMQAWKAANPDPDFPPETGPGPTK